MVAAIRIKELTASMTGTDKTGGIVRFKLADDQTVDTNDPITIPTGVMGSKRSFTKQLRMFCATAPGTSVDNLKMYSDGAMGFGTGVSVNASNVGVTFGANATTALTDGTDLFGFTTPGSEMNMDGVDTTALTATGFGGDIVKLQMEVATTASAGSLAGSAETITFAYDEV